MADPRNERFLTLDKNPQQLFDAWQKAGKIPLEFGSFQELEAAYNQLLKTGITEKAAREALGVTYRNVDGQNLLQRNIASDGSERGLNKRAVRTDLNIGTENHLLNRGGQEALDARKAEILTDWNKLSKLEAQQLGIETGKQFHRGHVVAGLEGGSLGIENMWPEHGARNVAHGSAPRLPMGVIEDLQIPRNDTETIYNRQLEAEGLAVPRPSNALMIAADEQMVDLYDNGFKPLNINGPQKLNADSRGYQRNNEAGRSPESMLATQNRLNELEAQGVNPQVIENWTREQSATLSRGNAVAESGPVKVVQPAVKKPVNVVPAGSTRAKPQLVSSGSAGSIGSKPVLTIKPPTNSSVAQAAATNKPAPKPTVKVVAKPAAKPAPKPTVNSKPKPTVTSATTKPDPRGQGSASMNIRRLQQSVPDALRIHPGGSLPSQSLVQGV
jgi:hypothetical protein